MLIHRLFDENSEVFIGYHDINPFHLNNEIVLAHRAYSTTKLPKSNDQVDIGFFSILANKYVKISSSYAWSIQQGSRLRWFTSSEKNDSVSFNNRIKKKFVNEVFDFRTFKKINEFPFPVYDLNELCSRAAVIDFSLIYRFRKHYGYYSNSYPTNSVLKIIDLVKNISLHEITIEVKHSNNFSQFIDHPRFNQNGSFLTYLRVIQNTYGKETHLNILDINTGLNTELNFSKKVSHFAWIDNENLLVYANSGLLGRGYYIIYKHRENWEYQIFKKFKRDGHPNFANVSSPIFASDTYANSFNKQSLYLGNIHNKSFDRILRLKSSKFYQNEFRCDLHPRLSLDSKLVAVDTTHFGKREIFIITLDTINSNTK